MDHNQTERFIAALENIGTGLHRLGNNDAATQMGALESLALEVKDGLQGLSHIASSIENLSSSVQSLAEKIQ